MKARTIKKSLIVILTVCVLIYVIARIFGPEILDRKFNNVIHPAPYNISEEALSLYQSFDFVSDLHSDLLLWKRDILKRSDYAQQDVPRNIEANMALQFFTLFNKVPAGLNFDKNPGDSDQVTPKMILQGRPVRTWFDLTERVLHLSETLHQYAKDSSGKLFVVESKSGLKSYLARRKLNRNITAGLLGIEGAQSLQFLKFQVCRSLCKNCWS